MSVPEALYVAGYILQIVSYLLATGKVSRKGNVRGLSCDYIFYSWLWFISNAYSGGNYLASTYVVFQYANRYPEYPTFYTSKLVFFLDCLGLLATSCLMYQIFRKYRSTRKGNEASSMLFYFVIGLVITGLVWLLWNYARGQETLNELDIANYFWLVAYVGFSFRLISQCSTNWFFSKFHIIHKNFMLLQIVSLLLLTSSLVSYRVRGTNWYELPTNIVSSESLLLNWMCMAVLLYQIQIYGSSKAVLGR